ncbi:hypothetical protein Z052_00870 [Halorubrum sp. C191]|nr:hypothetical protein Z052_00870 [Halorubrum sp. C191]
MLLVEYFSHRKVCSKMASRWWFVNIDCLNEEIRVFISKLRDVVSGELSGTTQSLFIDKIAHPVR